MNTKLVKIAIFLILSLSMILSAFAQSPEEAKKVLEQKGIHYTVDDFTHSAKVGDTEKVRLFIAAGIDVNAKDNDGMTALIAASIKGHTDTVQALLAKGADVNAKTNDGTTALMEASKGGHTDIVQILRAKGGPRVMGSGLHS